MILSLACDTILILSQEALFCYPHHFRLLYSPQHSWGIRLFIYDGKDFAIEFNHFRSIKGCFDKDSNIEIMENTLNEKENIFYTENNEMIEDVLKQLLEIHKNVYRR